MPIVPDEVKSASRLGLMEALRGGEPVNFKHVEPVVKSLSDVVSVKRADLEPAWQKRGGKWSLIEQTARLTRPVHEAHGQCYGFQEDRDGWELPVMVNQSNVEARPGYDSCSASEYLDTEPVLRAKVKAMAGLVASSRCTVVYAGAGLSTSAGISDYASQGVSVSKGAAEVLRSPMCAQPTTAHRVLVGLHRAGHLHRIIQQNHDGLPQKAGMPQQVVNEIHGAIHAPDNPVVAMSGDLRADLFQDLLDCEAAADLSIAVGTSLCGMNADRVVLTPAAKAPKRALGAIIIGLQCTVHDGEATLRIFAHCDTVFSLLAEELALTAVPPPRTEGEFFRPPVLNRGEGATGQEVPDSAYLLQGLSYDAAGTYMMDGEHGTRGGFLDLREGAKLVVTAGKHAGAVGEVDSYDREGNPRCRFQVRLKKDKAFKVGHMLVLGSWWLQAAADGAAPRLPVVNEPDEADSSPGAEAVRALCAEYDRLMPSRPSNAPPPPPKGWNVPEEVVYGPARNCLMHEIRSSLKGVAA